MILRILAYGSGLLSLAFCSLVILSLLKIRGRVAGALAFAILNCAQIILVVQLLSLFKAISVAGLLLIHLPAAMALWFLGNRPPWPRLHPLRWWREIPDGPLRLLILLVCLCGLINLFLVLAIPPNTHDGMTYHMARVGYYLQQKSLDSFPSPNLGQTVFPANAEILILWQVVLLRTDLTAGLVQWLSWVGTILAIFGVARLAGLRIAQALFAGLAFACLPEVVLQSTSTQNDLVTAFFLVCAFFFLARVGSNGHGPGYLVLSALSAALAVGTKPHALLAVPFLGLLLLVRLRQHGRLTVRGVMTAAPVYAAAFILLGSYYYIQNFRLYGSPAGPKPVQELHRLDRIDPAAFWSNANRMMLQAMAPAGMVPPVLGLPDKVFTLYRRASGSLFEALGVSRSLPDRDFMAIGWTDPVGPAIHEDLAWFGPLPFLIGPLILAMVVSRRREAYALCLMLLMVLAALGYFLFSAALLRWSPWFGRYMVSATALSAPWLALLYADREGGRWQRLSNVVLVGLCALPLVTCCCFNQMKPLRGARSIWGRDRVELLCWNKPSASRLVRIMDGLGNGEKRVGIVFPHEDEFQYPFFGRQFQNSIRPILFDRPGSADAARLPKFDALLFFGESQRFMLSGPSPFATDRSFGNVDLAPLLSQLRAPNSGWRALIDNDGFGHLFVRQEFDLRAVNTAAWPDVIPGQASWADGWVAKRFSAHVRLDPQRPVLRVQGETPGLSVVPILEVGTRDRLAFERVEFDRPGPFSFELPLTRLIEESRTGYTVVDFNCNADFNPSKLGRSTDARDLSWRLMKMELVPAASRLPSAPDYKPGFRWYSDRWVEKRFSVQFRRDPSRPVLQVRGDMQFWAGQPELKILSGTTVLATHRPSDSAVFLYRVSLASVFAKSDADFVTIDFVSNVSFNPKRLGQSTDDRELSWRLHSLELVR